MKEDLEVVGVAMFYVMSKLRTCWISINTTHLHCCVDRRIHIFRKFAQHRHDRYAY